MQQALAHSVRCRRTKRRCQLLRSPYTLMPCTTLTHTPVHSSGQRHVKPYPTRYTCLTVPRACRHPHKPRTHPLTPAVLLARHRGQASHLILVPAPHCPHRLLGAATTAHNKTCVLTPGHPAPFHRALQHLARYPAGPASSPPPRNAPQTPPNAPKRPRRRPQKAPLAPHRAGPRHKGIITQPLPPHPVHGVNLAVLGDVRVPLVIRDSEACIPHGRIGRRAARGGAPWGRVAAADEPWQRGTEPKMLHAPRHASSTTDKPLT